MSKVKQEFIAANWQQWLADENLLDFNEWWHLQLPAVDETNTGRGGWSTVFKLERHGKTFYVKRQANYLSRSISSWGRKVPTFKLEFDQIERYQHKRIPTLSVVYFGCRKCGGESEAVLVTEALTEHLSLDDLLGQKQEMAFALKYRILIAVAKAIARLHRAGIEHYNLYPKHIFVKSDRKGCGEGIIDVRFIDLETSRHLFSFGWGNKAVFNRRKCRDIETLSRRSPWLSRSDKLRVLLSYLGKERVDAKVRRAIKMISKRTLGKISAKR